MCVFSVDAAFDESKLGIPTITSITDNSSNITIKFKSSAPDDLCKSVRCGIMIYEDKTDKLYRLSNNSTSFPVKNLKKGQTYAFSVAQYYIDSKGIYANYKLSAKKTITFGASSTNGNLACSFESLPNRPLSAKVSDNVYIVCTTKNGETLKNYKSPSSSKIKLSSNSYGSVSKPVYVSSSKSGTGTKYKYRIKYTATKSKNKTGKIKINVLKGFVVTTKGTQSAALNSSTIRIDTKMPQLGSTKNKKSTSGYYKVSSKTPLKLTFKCSDSNGVSSMKVGSKTYDAKGKTSYSRTYKLSSGHSKYTYKITCKDMAGNKTTKTYSYKTKVYSKSASKCGKTAIYKTRTSSSYQYYWGSWTTGKTRNASSCGKSTVGRWQASCTTKKVKTTSCTKCTIGSPKSGHCKLIENYKMDWKSGKRKFVGYSSNPCKAYKYVTKTTCKQRQCKSRKITNTSRVVTGYNIHSCWHY